MVLVCILFALLFGFTIGISTPNFGALVRFKIPLVPFYVVGLYVIDLLNRQRLGYLQHGLRFDLTSFQQGDPRPQARPVVAQRKASQRKAR